jgi:hypothetical protein
MPIGGCNPGCRSFGMLVYEVVTGGRTPFEGLDLASMASLLRSGKRLEFPGGPAHLLSQCVACDTLGELRHGPL